MKLKIQFICDIEGIPACSFSKDFDLPSFKLANNDGDTKKRNIIRKAVKAFIAFRRNYCYLLMWSDFYYGLRGCGLISKDMSAREFGKLISECGGPDAESVRKSGNYNYSTLDLLKNKQRIDLISGFIDAD